MYATKYLYESITSISITIFLSLSGISMDVFILVIIQLLFTNNVFSLDIEGGEFQVLKTIPWDKVSMYV